LGWTIDRERVFAPARGTPAYEQIAAAIEAAITQGELSAGEQLPTVRALARQLKVSSASVAVAYSVLERRGRVDAHVGRGTFVRDGRRAGEPDAPRARAAIPVADAQRRAELGARPSASGSLRRRVLYFGDRLRAVNPGALVCTSSWPDPTLLPLQVLKDGFATVLEHMQPGDLQYSGPWAHRELAEALLPRLERDGIVADPSHLVVVNSVAQLLGLTLDIAPAVVGTNDLCVAVEEPGYHSAFNLIESRGVRLIGVEDDADGAQPESLGAALAGGANLVLLTPRALNPTGAS